MALVFNTSALVPDVEPTIVLSAKVDAVISVLLYCACNFTYSYSKFKTSSPPVTLLPFSKT